MDFDERTATAKALFGRPVRVFLAHWILTGAPAAGFSLTQAQDALSEKPYSQPRSAVQQEVDVLKRFGMLTDRGTNRERSYRRTRSSYWQAFEAIGRSLKLPKA